MSVFTGPKCIGRKICPSSTLGLMSAMASEEPRRERIVTRPPAEMPRRVASSGLISAVRKVGPRLRRTSLLSVREPVVLVLRSRGR